jgi:hypothetical protein
MVKDAVRQGLRADWEARGRSLGTYLFGLWRAGNDNLGRAAGFRAGKRDADDRCGEKKRCYVDDTAQASELGGMTTGSVPAAW